MYSYGPPHMAGQKQDDQLEHTFSSNVRIRDVALKTYQRRWTIGRSGERGSGISVLAARHDDDNEGRSKDLLYFEYEVQFSSFCWGHWDREQQSDASNEQKLPYSLRKRSTLNLSCLNWTRVLPNVKNMTWAWHRHDV